MSKPKIRQKYQAFLQTFLSPGQVNESKEVNGFIVFRHWDGNLKAWVYDLFTKESWSNMLSREKKKQDKQNSIFDLLDKSKKKYGKNI